jgi:hypothetical protein
MPSTNFNKSLQCVHEMHEIATREGVRLTKHEVEIPRHYELTGRHASKALH